MDTYQQFILASLQSVSGIATASFGKVKSQEKADDRNQILTETDVVIGKKLVELIRSSYPNHNIIDEESGCLDNKSTYTWVIDPIDGTSNFALGIPHYGIMIGLLEGEKSVAGGVALPYFSEIYVAAQGQGAFCNGKRIVVTKEQKLSKVLLSYGIDGHPEAPEKTTRETEILRDIILAIRNLRTSNSCYDICSVATGKYGAWLNQTSKIWDNVALNILVEESGGVYTDFWGKPMDYSHPLTKADSNFTVCAASPILHRQLQEIIARCVSR